ncbi:oligosaccharide flippase family protein [Superficieibacter sp.]|uniref:lipopolysaccharide biosynthesis protein n=1 Tax=Superficieibacter sp. TaxID=2303322 RepID=UPI0028B13870|nr:oligosaccharide flippase family protein [Superficieibacter sp.]
MNNKLLSNIFSLTFVKFFDVFIPILLIPFLIRVLGSDGYGVFATCLVSLNFLLTLTDFGVNVHATKLIATTRNKYKPLFILRNVIYTKCFLLAIAIAIIFFIGLYYSGQYLIICMIMSIALIGDAFSPLCYYQGLQKLRFYAIISLVWRTLSAILVVLLVKDKNDIFVYALLHSATYFVISLNLYVHIIKQNNLLKIKKQFQKLNFKTNSKSILIGGWQIYSYRCMSGLFLPILTNFIAITNTSDMVAVFNVIQRLFSAAYRFFEPINSAIYPYLSKSYKESFSFFRAKSIKFLFLFLGISLGGYAVSLIIKPYVIDFFVGSTPIKDKDIDYMYIFIGLSLVFNAMNLYITHNMIILNQTRFIKYFVSISLIVLLLGLSIIYYLSLSIVYISIMSFLPSMIIFSFAFFLYIKAFKLN